FNEFYCEIGDEKRALQKKMEAIQCILFMPFHVVLEILFLNHVSAAFFPVLMRGCGAVLRDKGDKDEVALVLCKSVHKKLCQLESACNTVNIVRETEERVGADNTIIHASVCLIIEGLKNIMDEIENEFTSH
ncbi:MAG: hypothetical protein GY820_36265, partial [Gammaproteobacteria bacterium]|nr:hypothetical protein [Gammaproteobacteria bacterium]